MKTILFACVHNAGRSQMAAAYLNRLAAPALARGVSAGTSPGARVHPEVVAVMREEGIELEGVTPQPLTLELASGADLLVTMGCGEACPTFPASRARTGRSPTPRAGLSRKSGSSAPRSGTAWRS